MLEQFRNELLKLGRALLSLLDVPYPDTKAVLAAIVKIEFLMQDQPEDISDQPPVSKQTTVKNSSRTFLFVR